MSEAWIMKVEPNRFSSNHLTPVQFGPRTSVLVGWSLVCTAPPARVALRCGMVAATSPLLYEELAADLATLIAKGTLRIGDRMPSVRQLSQQRDVSVSTVLQAYLLL